MLRCSDSPEAIERLANSDAEREPNFHMLVEFARWFSEHKVETLGRSYGNIVDRFITERRSNI
ncbi:hypothetical protein HWC80_gp080 [Mycobacterium phage Indlulamithi]|uniref:Uncharacterized protein n=1 Tax=Mycobacterium phage Indlulamithi TaxID=2656582 RepID=A0A649VDV1_9CAUD|nr:hypothetical protein HWC80_gp080 [Mycobacterium phage Indlulamithi]QGJ90132.1 hypothetical protein PBI_INDLULAMITHI_94 [Mycobacterium phage Indlulamithi]